MRKEIRGIRKNIFQIYISSDISLDEEQRKSYNSFNNTASKNAWLEPYKNEKEFLLKEEKIKLAFIKLRYDKLICQEKGHDEEVVSTGSDGAYVSCKRCHTGYRRPMNQKEYKSFHEIMNTPFTI